MIYCGILIVL